MGATLNSTVTGDEKLKHLKLHQGKKYSELSATEQYHVDQLYDQDMAFQRQNKKTILKRTGERDDGSEE